MEIVPLTVSRPLYSRYQITYQRHGLVLGFVAVIINIHSWFAFLNVSKMSSMNNWDISLKQYNAEFKRYLANFWRVDLLLSFRCNVRSPYRIFSLQHCFLRNFTPIKVGL